MCSFKIEDELAKINNKSLFSSLEKFCAFNAAQSTTKALRSAQAQAQLAKFRRVAYRFLLLVSSQFALILQKLRMQVLNNIVSFGHQPETTFEGYFR